MPTILLTSRKEPQEGEPTRMAEAHAIGLRLTEALADLGVAITVRETDQGPAYPAIAISDHRHPFPALLGHVWWYGTKWEARPKGKRLCLEEGWCCCTTIIGGDSEKPTPTVEAIVEHLRHDLGWHRLWHPAQTEA